MTQTKKLKLVPVRKQILLDLNTGKLLYHFGGFGNRMRSHTWIIRSITMETIDKETEIRKIDFDWLLKNHCLDNDPVGTRAAGALRYVYKLSDNGRAIVAQLGAAQP